MNQSTTGANNGGYRDSNQATSGGAVNTTGFSYVGANISGPGTITTVNIPVRSNPVPTFQEAGIRAGEIVAYRAWQIIYGKLHSMYCHWYEWTPHKNEQTEPPYVQGSDAYRSHGGFGFYAFKELERAKMEYGSFLIGGNEGIVFGEVLLWGTVIEHERGYRAEYAKINKILEISQDGSKWYKPRWYKPWHPQRRMLDLMREKYGV